MRWPHVIGDMSDPTLLTLGEESIPLLQDLGEVLEIGIVTLDRDLVVRSWNRWLAAASGREAADVVGRPLFELFDDLPGSSTETALRRALDGTTTMWAQRFHQYILPFAPPGGYERFQRMQQSARIMPLRRGQEVTGVLLLVQDVTERVAREDELRVALQHAESASRAKSEFLASMSHELRTPLSAVVGYVDLLQADLVGPMLPQQKLYLGRVKGAAHHLIKIVEEILTFTKLDAGKEEVHLEELDAAEIATDVELMLEPQALLKGLTLRCETPDHPVRLVTDGTKLRQILLNLLGNAVKFTDAGEVRLQVSADEEFVGFCIQDCGAGIAKEDLERIFDPFTQVDQSLMRKQGGTGLGLPVSRRLAHLLGGELTVDSTHSQGSTFTLRLPRTAKAPVAAVAGREGSRV
jgi:PAS domain S-box-containing protein